MLEIDYGRGGFQLPLYYQDASQSWGGEAQLSQARANRLVKAWAIFGFGRGRPICGLSYGGYSLQDCTELDHLWGGGAQRTGALRSCGATLW